MSDNELQDLLSRASAGDQSAWEELVSKYVPAMKSVIRRQLDAREWIRNDWDSDDFVQIVLGKFCVVLAERPLDVKDSKELAAYLFQMARNAVEDEARHLRAKRHGGSETHVSWSKAIEEQLIDNCPDPSERLQCEEALARVRHLMSDEEWRLALCWARGQSWQQIAVDFGRSAEALRKEWARIVKRIRAKLVQGEEQESNGSNPDVAG